MNGRTEWECYLTYTAVLLGEDDSIRSITLRSSVEGEIRTEGETDNLLLDVKVEDLAMRALDPRRINGRCRICVTAYSRYAVMTSPDLNAQGDASGSFYKKSSAATYTTLERMTLGDRRVSHDVELDSSMPEIADIVYCGVKPFIGGVIVKDGRCELRGEAGVDLCYCDRDGSYRTYTSNIPISDGFDLPEGNFRGGVARASVGEIKVAARNNSYAENKVIELDFSWNAEVSLAAEGEYEVVDDIYSTVYDLDVKQRDIELDRCCGSFCGSLSVGGEEDYSDLMIDSLQNIVCYRPDVKLTEIRRIDDRHMRFGGNVRIGVVYSCDSAKERHALCEINLPFKYEKEIAVASDNFECVTDVYVSSLRIRTDHSKFRVDCEVGISALVTESFTGRGIVECNVKGELDIVRAPMTLCFKNSSDSLWDISKRYNVSPAELLERNGIDESEFDSGRVIIIPSATKR